MRLSSHLLLNFLLSACWQTLLIATVASFCARLLRDSSARHRHLVWVAALILSFLVPAITCARLLFVTPNQSTPVQMVNIQNQFAELRLPESLTLQTDDVTATSNDIQLN